jgi:hypothetical protein
VRGSGKLVPIGRLARSGISLSAALVGVVAASIGVEVTAHFERIELRVGTASKSKAVELREWSVALVGALAASVLPRVIKDERG